MAILNLEWRFLISKQSCEPTRRTTVISISVPQALPVPCPARRVVVFCSAGASSSLLEGASSNELQVFQFCSKSPAFQTPAAPISDLGGSDGLLMELKSSSTEDLALDYYQKAKRQPGFRQDSRALRTLIRYMLRSKKWDSISSVLEDFKSSGVFLDKSTCSILIGSCVRARKFKIAESLLDIVAISPALTLTAFGAAMRGYNKLHMYSSTVALWDRMVGAGLLPDTGCYCWVMDAQRKLGNADNVVTLFHEYESRNLGASQPSLLVQIYLILCDALGRSRRAFEALRYFREMTEKGFPPDTPFYASLICSFAEIKEAEIAEDLLQEAKGKGLVKDSSVFLKLVLMYVEVAQVWKTIEVVAMMKEMGIRVSDCVFCAVINGHVKTGGLRASVGAYEKLISLGCVPGQVTYASVINVYCRLGLFTKAESVFKEMLERGFNRCVVAYANMISMYGKANRIKDAMKLLARMKEKGCEPNVWVYNSLIDMHGKVLNLRQVEKLWKEMKRRKIDPDKVSYTSVIVAYSKAKEFKECVEFYQEFRMNGGKVDRAMAGIMVGIFSKTNRLKELIDLLQHAKAEGIQLDERLYMSSLNALRDAGLQIQLKWFRQSFSYAKSEG